MQTFSMRANLLPGLIEALAAFGPVWAPVERVPGVYSLEVIHDASKACPEAVRTILPFKKLLLEPAFAMLEGIPGEAASAGPSERAADRGPQVLLGAHACDIHALKILDLLYCSDYQDPYYQRNRDQLLIVGHACWPDERCFCQSLDTSSADDGFDLFLTPLDDRLLVAVGSSRGDDVVRANPHLFEPSTRDDVRNYLKRLEQRRKAFQLALDVTDLPFVLELKRHDPVWEELGRRCLCCGSCSMVCPTCSCFNVLDQIPEEGRAVRLRTWDSCLYRDYAMVAGGHSFRSTRADRVRNRYYHKQEAFVREFGMPSCVGCGRCIESCPTAINVVEVFKHVRGEL